MGIELLLPDIKLNGFPSISYSMQLLIKGMALLKAIPAYIIYLFHNFNWEFVTQ